MVHRAEGWRFSCEYDRELYDPATVALLLEQFQEVLQQVTRDPQTRLQDVSLPAKARGTLAEGTPGRFVSTVQ